MALNPDGEDGNDDGYIEVDDGYVIKNGSEFASSKNGSEEEARGKENMRRVHSDGELNSLSGRSNPKAIPSRAKDGASVISMCRSMSTGHMSSSDALSETECYVSLSLGAGA